MQIEDWRVDKLIDYDRNPRKNDHVVDSMAAAIKEFGFRVPILAKKDGLVIDGHLRLKAAKKLNRMTVPVVVVDDLSDPKIKAFRISINRMAELADWDKDLLKLELEELKIEGIDLEITGLDNLDIILNNDIKEPKKHEEPKGPMESICSPGDIWEIGKHTLMCGDAFNDDQVRELLKASGCPDIIFTDPPYEFQDISQAIIYSNESIIICTFKQAATLFANDSINFHFDFVLDAKVPKSFSTKRIPYYTHQNGVVFTQNGKSTFNCDNTIGRRSEQGYWHTIIDSPRSTRATHSHSKNLDGMIDVLSGWKPKLVYDPFIGSGTTFDVCDYFNISGVGMDIDVYNCDYILNKYMNSTEEEPLRIN